MKRVYTASKLSAAPMWRQLQQDWGSAAFFHARWLRHCELGTPDSPEAAPGFWLEDEEDVGTSDALLVWGEPGQALRGALVEAGIAIARGVPVLVIGENESYGTWQYHPGVERAADFVEALRWIKALP